MASSAYVPRPTTVLHFHSKFVVSKYVHSSFIVRWVVTLGLSGTFSSVSSSLVFRPVPKVVLVISLELPVLSV